MLHDCPVHRNLPCSATTGGTTRSPSVILVRRRAQILRLPPKSALNAVSFHTVTERSIAHAKQIKPAGATAKLAQNSALSARREKGICILCCNSGSRPCKLGAKQTIFQDEPGSRLQSRFRGSLEAIEIATKQKM